MTQYNNILHDISYHIYMFITCDDIMLPSLVCSLPCSDEAHLAHELADAAALRHEVHALQARQAQVEDRGALRRQPPQTETRQDNAYYKSCE